MKLFAFILVAIYCLDYGFRWQTKRAIVLFVLAFALACHGQDMPPPMPSAVPHLSRPVSVGQINISWTPSISPNVVSTIVLWMTNGIVLATNVFANSTTNGLFEYWPNVTNFYYGVAVNEAGISSSLSKPLTFSGWAYSDYRVLSESTDMLHWTNIFCEPQTNTVFWRDGLKSVKEAMP